jgi:hypothetical protein
VLVAAGIHPIGLQGVAALFETDLADLYREVRTRRFSMIVECRYDPETLTVTEATPATAPHLHP